MSESSTSLIKQKLEQSVQKRKRSERRFQLLGKAAVSLGVLFIVVLFSSIISKGYKAFYTHYISLEVPMNVLAESETDIQKLDYNLIIKDALKNRFNNVDSRSDRRALYELITSNASYRLQDIIEDSPEKINETVTLTVPVGDDIDVYLKGYFDKDNARINEKQIAWVDELVANNEINKGFNTNFFTNGDSREPEQAGIRGAMMGSLFTLMVTFLLSFPIGVMAACYLEEFAPKNRLTDIIEVNINNLAAVPSIVFGLLGLAVFINFFGFPRSTALVGGFVLALMTLPTIIISSRAALKSVPPSIRAAALGMGASPLQTLFHHTLPLAMPGMLTGSIIGMAQALGETAPLLMIGMIAFIVDIPSTPVDPSTVLPVQIYLWADSPERAFVEKTSAAIIVLLFFLIAMNSFAVYLRKKFERKW